MDKVVKLRILQMSVAWTLYWFTYKNCQTFNSWTVLIFQSMFMQESSLLLIIMISSYPSAFGSPGAAEAPRTGRPLENTEQRTRTESWIKQQEDVPSENSARAGKSLWQANKHHLTRLQLQGESSVLQRLVFMFVRRCTLPSSQGHPSSSKRHFLPNACMTSTFVWVEQRNKTSCRVSFSRTVIPLVSVSIIKMCVDSSNERM